MSTTRERVIRIVRKMFERDVVRDEDRFAEDYDADSLEMVELVMAAEHVVGTEIDDDEAEKARTVGQFIELCERTAERRGGARMNPIESVTEWCEGVGHGPEHKALYIALVLEEVAELLGSLDFPCVHPGVITTATRWAL